MKLILCRGVFDILHVGHIRHFQQAKAIGDFLVVAVTQDRFVNKGPGRPVHPLDMRIEQLRALRFIDEVTPGIGPDATIDIRFWQPAVFVKGPECRKVQSEGLLREIKAVHDIGGEIVYTDGEIYSSSELLNKVLSYG